MCHIYLLRCPACETAEQRPYFCAELAARRESHQPTEPSPEKPTSTDCGLPHPADDGIKTSTYYQPVMGKALSRHVCKTCKFHFWYALDEEDDGGCEDLGSEEAMKKREREVKISELHPYFRKRDDRIEPQ